MQKGIYDTLRAQIEAFETTFGRRIPELNLTRAEAGELLLEIYGLHTFHGYRVNITEPCTTPNPKPSDPL
jgi:hypothetical protein